MNDIPNKNEVTRGSDDAVASRNPGPYIARVIEHLDSLYLGGLRVELLKTAEAGNIGETLGQTVEVYYASPFYGTTNSQKGPSKNNDYASTQKSYGFWAVPPDPGTLVLVTFVEGSRDFGYWFACIPEKGMTFMTPGGQPATEQLTGDVPSELKGKRLPAGEYNKAITKPNTNNVVKYKRPINDEFVEKLVEQGLVEDDIRGITSTSAQRETPSAVVGFSSPGPLDKRGGKPTAPVGLKESKANIPTSRLGSSSIVIDDGDDKLIREGPPADTPYKYINKEASEGGGDVTMPHNELIRLRTRTGAQVLMHTSEDLIYINNSNGSCWIEMSANGKLDVYAQDSISFHTENDMNFTADRDINFEAGRNINMIVNENIYQSAAKNYELLVGIDGKIKCKNNLETTVTNDMKTTVLNDKQVLVTNNFSATAENDISLYAENAMNLTGDEGVGAYAGKDIKFTAAGDTHISASRHYETASRIDMNGPAAKTTNPGEKATEATLPIKAKFPQRIPQHEPWQGHENWNPVETAPDKTEAVDTESQDKHFENRTVQTDRTPMNELTPEEEE